MRVLDIPRVGVRVERRRRGGRTFILSPESEDKALVVARAGTRIVRLEPEELVLSQDGEVIPATGAFYRTVDTIDPYHVVFDIF